MKLTAKAPKNRPKPPTGKPSSPNHPSSLYVSFREGNFLFVVETCRNPWDLEYIDFNIYDIKCITKSIGQHTPPRFNMEPGNDGFQKESPFPGTSFQVPMLNFRGVPVPWIRNGNPGGPFA